MKVQPRLSVLPAALATECVHYSGCPGCGVVSSVSFTAEGSVCTAVAPLSGTMVIDDVAIYIKSSGSKWALFCLYGAARFPLGAGDDCSTTRGSGEGPSFGLMVWAQ